MEKSELKVLPMNNFIAMLFFLCVLFLALGAMMGYAIGWLNMNGVCQAILRASVV